MKSRNKKNGAFCSDRSGPGIIAALTGLIVANVAAVALAQQDDGERMAWPSTSVHGDGQVQRADFQALPIRTADLRHDAMSDAADDALGELPEGDGATGSTDASSPWWAPIRNNLQKIDLPRMAGSLAIVLGLYLGFVWLVKAFGSRANRAVPREVVDVLGYVPIGPKQRMQVIRLGSKLLLVVQNENGMQTVGEITDPNEADYLTALCQGKPVPRYERPAPRTPRTDGVRSNNLRSILNQLETALTNESSRTQFDA